MAKKAKKGKRFLKVHKHLNAPVHDKVAILALTLAAALVLNLLNKEAGALAQEASVPESSNITAPAVQPEIIQPAPAPTPVIAPETPIQPSASSEGQPAPSPEPVPAPPHLEGEDDEPQEEYVDPREIRDVLRQIKQMRIDLRSLARQLVQLKGIPSKTEDLAKIKELTNLIATNEQNIKNPQEGQRAALQEFYDARLWDEIQVLRTKIQLPRELKDIARAITRTERMLKLKTFQKLGLDIARLQTKLDEIKNTYNQINNAYQAGDLETAQEGMQEFYQGGHPGGFEGALHRIRGIKDLLRQIRDKEIIAAIEEMLSPVYESLYEGDFNEVHNVLNEYEDDLRRLVSRINKSRLRYSRVESNISDLEELIRSKFDSLEAQKNNNAPTETAPQAVPAQ